MTSQSIFWMSFLRTFSVYKLVSTLIHTREYISSIRGLEVTGLGLDPCPHESFWHFLTKQCRLWLLRETVCVSSGNKLFIKHSWNYLHTSLYPVVKKSSPPPQMPYPPCCMFVCYFLYSFIHNCIAGIHFLNPSVSPRCPQDKSQPYWPACADVTKFHSLGA